jgi:hypothetical protein
MFWQGDVPPPLANGIMCLNAMINPALNISRFDKGQNSHFDAYAFGKFIKFA